MDPSFKSAFHDMIGSLPVGMIFLKKSGSCLYANHFFEELVGLEQGESTDRGWLSHLRATDQSKVNLLFQGSAVDLRFEYPQKKRLLRFTPTSLKDGLYGCTVTDITDTQAQLDERRSLKEDAGRQKKLMQEILDSTEAILYSVDQYGKVTAFNKAANQAVQLRKGVPIRLGDFWPDIVSGESGLERDKMLQLLELVLSGQSYKTIKDISVSNGEKITYSVQASPMFDEGGKIIGAVLCAHNITVLTQLQRESAEKTLMRARELESWNHFYDMLIAVLAHDLRHPLSVIVLNADVFAHTNKLFSEDRVKELMNRLRNTCSKSIDLLQGLLCWVKSKKEAFSYQSEPLNLVRIIQEANGLFVEDQEKKGISLKNEVASEHIVEAHEQMMLFICRNLINNATKYAPVNSLISVRSVLSTKEITLTIRDEGPGMSSDQLSGLFSIKEHIKTADPGIKGAGMALVIAHDMVAQMNGRIWAESEPGKGTSFYVALPVLSPDQA